MTEEYILQKIRKTKEHILYSLLSFGFLFFYLLCYGIQENPVMAGGLVFFGVESSYLTHIRLRRLKYLLHDGQE